MRKPKPTLNETIRINEKALRGLCMLGGKPIPEGFDTPAVEVKPRSVVNPSDPHDLEASVMREVASVLAKHPKVLFAIRQNSGSMEVESNGNKMPIWFYRWARSRESMTLPDYWGLLTDGRMFALECKRRNWIKPTGEREGKQLAFLLTVRYARGIGEFVTCGEDAIKCLSV